ncbi:uncharacterized protein LOC118209570 [Anguilla anguilla]|uniref:uncharacterized protein LOC118209570 n=1 Tax=Anguilla anguilla TaxID=7936 RepID=UPI0015B35E72|nr:uncharacterized protein LOC118209570 [Anguilla anguilla]
MDLSDGLQENMPVRILRDTGAAQSFLLDGVLPLSEKTSTGTHVLVRGLEMGFVDVPLHRIHLISDLITGNVVVGVRKNLPVPGITFLLGNDLAGGNVWGHSSTPPEVVPVPLVPEGPDECAQMYPEVFPTCVLTRSMVKQLQSSVKSEDTEVDLSHTFLMCPDMSVSPTAPLSAPVTLPTVEVESVKISEVPLARETHFCPKR